MKRYDVVFAAVARAQLEAIETYIAQESSGQIAERYVEAITERCLALEQFPNRGTPRDDIRPGVRTLAFRRRVTVAYTVGADRVEILGVFYGGRDFETLLRGDEPISAR